MRRTVAGLLLSPFAATGVAAQLPLPPPVPPANNPAHCTAAEDRQLDFWLGDWDVYNTEVANEMRGVSKVTRAYYGCVIREEWSPFTMLTGGSVNAYDRHAKVWRQTWVDSMGGRADLAGAFADGKLVLTGTTTGANGSRPSRLTLAPGPGDTVRQIAEFSEDGGKTWKPSFDFTYKRRKPQG